MAQSPESVHKKLELIAPAFIVLLHTDIRNHSILVTGHNPPGQNPPFSGKAE